jgi:uncharacterized protein YndB with AHSA1/START domain
MNTQTPATAASTADREITITRTVKAPRALVWKVCTMPEHIDQWWGPNGFTNKTLHMDLRVGGEWKYTMTSAEGTVFPNLIIYREITPIERIAFDHGDWDDPEMFKGSLTFTEVDGGTLITLHSIFPTKEDRDLVVEKYGAIEGGEQTLAHLDEYLAHLL